MPMVWLLTTTRREGFGIDNTQAFTHAHQQLPFTKQLVAASTVLLPFQPLIVAGTHTLGTEVCPSKANVFA